MADSPKVSRSPSDEHEFYTLTQKPFEHFARALHEAQPDILVTHLYGPDGQTQFGADHIAYHRTDGAPYLEVGQSKACRRFRRKEVAAAARAFLDHWETHWRTKDVRRFILFVGCAIKSRQAHDEIIEQTRTFAALGVTFAVWDANIIYDQLGSAPAVVRTHLGQEWYEKLFGEPTGPLTGLQRDLQKGDFGAIRVAGYVARLNQAEGAEVIELRRRARRGEVDQVVAHLEMALFRSPASNATAPEVRAQMLRLLAGLLLPRADYARIKQYLDEADNLDGDSQRLRAVLLLDSVGADALLAHTAGNTEAAIAEVRAIALLRQHRPREALGELEKQLSTDEASSETLRIAALATLLLGHRDEALALAERAALRDSDSRACQQAVAICFFHRALSPMVDVSTGEWPLPVDQPLVGTSDLARADLERAEQLFSALMADPSLADHRSMVMWHFGVLACMSWRRAEAEDRVRALQSTGDLPIPLVGWCISRGLPFDPAAAAAQCEDQLASEPNDFETLLIRVALANFQREPARARELLDSHRRALEEAGHTDLYNYWSAVLDMETHRTPARDVLEAHPWLKLRVALDIRQKKLRLKAIAAILESTLEARGDARVIIAAAQLLLDGGWHKTAVKAATYLIEAVGTGEAIGLAAHALYRARRPTEVLKALDNGEAFPGGRLPVDLERLRAECLAVSGDIVSARDTSLAIARSTGNARDIWRSIEFHIAMGAAPAALALYNEHSAVLSEPSPGHVILARAVLRSDPEAAARITRQLAASTPDELVTATFELASKLRLDTEQRVLIGRIQALGAAGAAGVEMVSIEDVVARMQRRHAQIEEVLERYANGHAPVQLIAGFRNAALPLIYLGPLLDPPAPEIRTPMLSARYGRRYEADAWPSDPGDTKLLVDLTGLLTAHGLDLLDTVERTFAPIWVAPDAINALLSLRDGLDVIQPDRVTAAERVVALFDAGELLDAAQTAQVDTFTVLWDRTGGEPAATLNFSRLFELVTLGVTRRDRSTFRKALGSTLEAKPSGAKPPQGALINLDIGMAESLEHAGLLAAALKRFKLTVGAEDVLRMRATVTEAVSQQRLAASLDLLVTRLSRGLEEGAYKVVPLQRTTTPNSNSNVLQRSFTQVMAAMADGQGIAWVDDRFTSSIDNPQFRVVTTVEAIDALLRYGRIGEDTAYRLRQRLRRARWQFMPTNGREIVHFLRAATRKDAVESTDDLVTLRRSVGEMLLHRRRLQWPDPQAAEEGIRGEVPYLLDAGHAITQALAAIWNDTRWAIADAQAASSWLLDYLEVGLFPLPILGAGDPRSDHLIGIQLGGLVLTGLQILPGKARKDRQSAFLTWLWDYVLSDSLRVRPECRSSMEDMVEQHLLRTLEGEPEDRTWLALAGNILNSMPLPLRLAFMRRPEVRAAFDLPEHGQVSVDVHDFDELEFWDAIAKLRFDNAVTVKAVSGEVGILKRLESDGEQAIGIQVGRRGFRLDDWPLRIADDDPSVRRSALEERVGILDLSFDELDALNDELAGESEPGRRVQLAMRRSHDSMQHWYAELASSIERRRSFRISDLAPDDARKVPHLLRLEQDLDVAARNLVAARGLATAIRRFGGLPIVPPRSLQEVVDQLSEEALDLFLDEVEGDTAPPWVQLFLASLILSRPQHSSGATGRMRGWVESALSDAAIPQWELYVALARFTCSEGPAIVGWHDLSAVQQLASCWLHASSTAETILAGHVQVDQLIEALDAHRMVSPRLLVEVPHKFTGDRADPRQVDDLRLKTFVSAPVLLTWAKDEAGAVWAVKLLRAQIVEMRNGNARPRVEIAHGGLMRDDALGSIFAPDWSDEFEALTPGSGALFGARLSALILEMLDFEPGSKEAGASWTFIRAASGDVPLPASLAEQVHTAAQKSDLAASAMGLADARYTLLAFTAIAAINGWVDQRERIATAAEVLGPDKSPSDDSSGMLLFEIAIWRARLEPDMLERTRVMANELLRLGRHPDLRQQAERAARHFARGLSGQQTEAFVDALAEFYAAH